ncbi:hypothetical protein C8035_v012016 [Colletotrichum spinosum]|uniref:Uncharacterized protein n=1 Tax=Colletotrichum spinosum TaxID=1347390 RepID=A0A4R8PWC0_9PEZI|nr:hypothetical protein C8035_v012016 [Colletotrichum spinosum]
MDRKEGHKHTHIPFHVDAQESQPDGRYQEHRSPQYKASNEPSQSLGPLSANNNLPFTDLSTMSISHENHEEDFLLVDPFDATSSDGTIVLDHAVSVVAEPSIGSASALTANNMNVHDRVARSYIGFMNDWLLDGRCAGDFVNRDTAPQESLQLDGGNSRVSPSTIVGDDDYVIYNHPSENFVTGAGHWADIAMPLDSSLHI